MAQEYDHERLQTLNNKYDCLLFDLDDTLYPVNSGIAAHCTKNIEDYMIHQLGIKESKVADMCCSLYNYYGTTMAGLRAIGYNFDYDHFHSFVHGRLPYDLLKPDLVLRNMLLRLPYRRLIFTNADKRHASECLKRLEIEDCFESIICFETLNPSNKAKENISSKFFNIVDHQPSSGVPLPATPIVCKPFESAFQRAFKITDIDPGRTMFFDDSVRNVSTAKSLGLNTVLVGKSKTSNCADYALESIHDIRHAFPELLESEEQILENGRYTRKIAAQAQ